MIRAFTRFSFKRKCSRNQTILQAKMADFFAGERKLAQECNLLPGLDT